MKRALLKSRYIDYHPYLQANILNITANASKDVLKPIPYIYIRHGDYFTTAFKEKYEGNTFNALNLNVFAARRTRTFQSPVSITNKETFISSYSSGEINHPGLVLNSKAPFTYLYNGSKNSIYFIVTSVRKFSSDKLNKALLISYHETPELIPLEYNYKADRRKFIIPHAPRDFRPKRQLQILTLRAFSLPVPLDEAKIKPANPVIKETTIDMELSHYGYLGIGVNPESIKDVTNIVNPYGKEKGVAMSRVIKDKDLKSSYRKVMLKNGTEILIKIKPTIKVK